MISNIKLLFDKRNNQWAIITLERMSSKSEIFVFSDLYNQKKELLIENSLIFITGKLSNRQSDNDDVLKIIAEDIINMKHARDKFSKHIHVKISYDENNPKILNSIKSLVVSNKGSCRFILNIETKLLLQFLFCFLSIKEPDSNNLYLIIIHIQTGGANEAGIRARGG